MTREAQVLHCQRFYSRSLNTLGYSRTERRTRIAKAYGKRRLRLRHYAVELGALLAAILIAVVLGLAGCLSITVNAGQPPAADVSAVEVTPSASATPTLDALGVRSL
jgi:hypothetical protein